MRGLPGVAVPWRGGATSGPAAVRCSAGPSSPGATGKGAEAMNYETTRAADLEASRRALEAEQNRELREAVIHLALVALWVAIAVVAALYYVGAMP